MCSRNVPPPPDGTEAGEKAWIEVIRKMDEVYNDLLHYEAALEAKNAALEDSQQFIESVLAAMSDILLVCNRSGVIEEVNRAVQSLCGLDEAALTGRSIFDSFADEASRQKAQHFFAGHGGEVLQDCEMQLRGADGAPIPVSLNCTPRFSAVGKMLGVVVTGRPVGELQRAYRALQRAHEDLKRTQQQLLQSEKMASLGRLVAGVAHELNNPISFSSMATCWPSSATPGGSTPISMRCADRSRGRESSRLARNCRSIACKRICRHCSTASPRAPSARATSSMA